MEVFDISFWGYFNLLLTLIKWEVKISIDKKLLVLFNIKLVEDPIKKLNKWFNIN